jgi:hypothetical protein
MHFGQDASYGKLWYYVLEFIWYSSTVDGAN